MEWDLLDEAARERWGAALQALGGALHTRDAAQVRSRQQALQEVVDRSMPPRRRSVVREYADIFLVALTVAMGIRTFFVQPFKIPTGSMQPTLWGIFSPEEYEKRYQLQHPGELRRAQNTGLDQSELRARADSGPPAFPLLRVLPFLFLGKSMSDPGTVQGDHVFVDKISYNFRRPRRGDIIVFDTKGIDIRDAHGNAADPKFYIKRLAGLPGEGLRIANRRLWIDGEEVVDPVFERIYGLGGYTNPDFGPFGSPAFSWPIPGDQYFALGDNTTVSQDSRYWAGVPRESLIGRGFWVYWPFFREKWQTAVVAPGRDRPPRVEEREPGYVLWFGPPQTRLPETATARTTPSS